MKFNSTSPNERLKEAIEASGGFKVVGKAIGVSWRTLYNTCKEGTAIKSDYLIELYRNYKIRPDQILIEENDNDVPEYDPSQFSSIRFFPNVTASAGGGLIAESEETLPLIFRTHFITNTLSANASKLFAIKSTGDSMEPDINDGDLLIVDESKKSFRADKPYVISIEGQVRVKILNRIGEGRVRLISKNKEYPPEEIPLSECHVHGEVRYIQRTLT